MLALSPKVAEPQVKALLFVVDPKTFDVRESVITDSQGNTNDLTFADIKTNTKLPDSDFKWSPPSGTRVDRHEQAGPLGRAAAPVGKSGKHDLFWP